jgi:hypothetical protein
MNVFTSIVLRSHFLAKATDNMAEMTMTTPTMMLKKTQFYFKLDLMNSK